MGWTAGGGGRLVSECDIDNLMVVTNPWLAGRDRESISAFRGRSRLGRSSARVVINDLRAEARRTINLLFRRMFVMRLIESGVTAVIVSEDRTDRRKPECSVTCHMPENIADRKNIEVELGDSLVYTKSLPITYNMFPIAFHLKS
ncbi:hypothetical protein J6590_040763 [Homalodisca vitripennis]|nr:hypothetical protein J6590_040763 [Homalodisca vitripennis]